MTEFTQNMMDILAIADTERGEINKVPFSTMQAFEARRLVSAEWRKPRGAGIVVDKSASGRLPTYSRVKLTAAGLRAATRLQGLIARCSEAILR